MSKSEKLSTHTKVQESPLSKILREIYSRLHNRYGRQQWWLADEPFEVMVGAILTQSTAWANVEKAIRNLKISKAMTPKSLRSLSIEQIADLIRPSGFYTVKARRLESFITWLGEYNDDLPTVFSKDTGCLRKELLSVYGIGEETADSILLYAAGKLVFVVDAYTRRIIDRVGTTPANRTYPGYQRLFMDNLPCNVEMFNEYHALLVQHGKTTCQKYPRCQQCCLLEICQYGLSTSTLSILSSH